MRFKILEKKNENTFCEKPTRFIIDFCSWNIILKYLISFSFLKTRELLLMLLFLSL
jgi:hypothetical protein